MGKPGHKMAVISNVPKKDCTCFLIRGSTWFLVTGRTLFLMASTWQAGVDICPLPTVWLRNASETEPIGTWFGHQASFSQSQDMVYIVHPGPTKYNNVIHVVSTKIPHAIQDFVHHLLE